MILWFVVSGARIYVSCDAAKLLITRIFPSSVNCRYFQHHIVNRDLNTKYFDFIFRPSKISLGKEFLFSPTIDPIHKASVLVLLSLRPDTLPNFLSVSRVADKEFLVPLRIKVVSSAY